MYASQLRVYPAVKKIPIVQVWHKMLPHACALQDFIEMNSLRNVYTVRDKIIILKISRENSALAITKIVMLL